MSDITIIIPTIGRPQSLYRLLRSLAKQTIAGLEVIVADGSFDDATRLVLQDPAWAAAGLLVRHLPVTPPHAVRQREAAIRASSRPLLLLLDDDVELDENCIEEMILALQSDQGAVAVMADLVNTGWPQPTAIWRAYLRLVHGLNNGEWSGRVVGPLLRFGFDPRPELVSPCEWFGAGNSLIKREAFDKSGGFSDFFLHRSTINEDIDLSVRISEIGQILFCPTARMHHFHDPVGRVSRRHAAEDDLYNRYHVLHITMRKSRWRAFLLVILYAGLESASNVVGSLRRLSWSSTGDLLYGRLVALLKIVRPIKLSMLSAQGRPK